MRVIKTAQLVLLALCCTLVILAGACSSSTNQDGEEDRAVSAGANADAEVAPVAAAASTGNLTISAQVRYDDSFIPPLDRSEESYPIWISIKRDNSPVTDARVVVAGVEVPFEPTANEHYAKLPGTPYSAGQEVRVEITVDGVTATESLVLPGAVAIGADGRTVSWSHEGNMDHLFVSPLTERGIPDRNATYETARGTNCERSADLVSPHSVSDAAYPSSGKYLMTVALRSRKPDAFSSLPGFRSGHLEVGVIKSALVTR